MFSDTTDTSVYSFFFFFFFFPVLFFFLFFLREALLFTKSTDGSFFILFTFSDDVNVAHWTCFVCLTKRVGYALVLNYTSSAYIKQRRKKLFSKKKIREIRKKCWGSFEKKKRTKEKKKKIEIFCRGYRTT